MASKITDSLRSSIAAEKQKDDTDTKTLQAIKKPSTKKTTTKKKSPAASNATSSVVHNKSSNSVTTTKPKKKSTTKKPQTVKKPSATKTTTKKKSPVASKTTTDVVHKKSSGSAVTTKKPNTKKPVVTPVKPKEKPVKKPVPKKAAVQENPTSSNSTAHMIHNKLHQLVENHHNVCKTYIENLLMANDSLHEYLDQLVEIKNLSSLIRLNLSYLTSTPTRYQKMLAQNKNIFSDFFKFTLTRD